MSVVYRCISARRWLDTDDECPHVPPLDLPPSPGRWNRADQHALYTSHDPAAAIEEKRRHLNINGRGPFGSIARAVGAAVATEVVVLAFSMPDLRARCFDGRTRPRRDFDEALDPCSYAAAYKMLDTIVVRDMAHLIVPSSPRPDAWNSVFYLGPGQVLPEDVPTRAAITVHGQGGITPNPPDCGT